VGVLRHEQCPACAEKGNDNGADNLGVYTDGTHCFSCGYNSFNDTGNAVVVVASESDDPRVDWRPQCGTHEALSDRGISQEICRKYDYTTTEVKGTEIRIANYRDREGRLVAQKIRGPNKAFLCKGDMRKAGLYGEHLWKKDGRRLIITEGEEDCLAIAHVLGGKWPVVSLPNGAAGAVAAIKRSYDFVNSYEAVLLSFDMDEAGEKAAVEVSEMLTPGKAKLVQLPRKDACAMLEAGETRILSTALWEAREYCPPGILSAAEVFARPKVHRKVYPFPWEEMNRKLYGQAEGTMLMIVSGTGMGKSTFVRNLAYDHLGNDHKVGMIMMEESPIETLHELMSFESGIPINQIMTARWLNEELERQNKAQIQFDIVDNLSDEVYAELKAKILEKDQLYLYDTDGQHKNIVSRVEYMAQALGCKVVILDHISLVIATMGVEGSERQGIDRLLAELRGIVDRTGIVLLVVCQLRKSDGKPYEEGGRVTLQDLRGSGMLSMVPNSVIAVERDQQHPDERQRNTLLVRSLKHRLSGYTGPVMALSWDQSTHQYTPAAFDIGSDGEITHGATNALNPMEIPNNE